MPTMFFRALNPFSTQSGIVYSLAGSNLVRTTEKDLSRICEKSSKHNHTYIITEENLYFLEAQRTFPTKVRFRQGKFLQELLNEKDFQIEKERITGKALALIKDYAEIPSLFDIDRKSFLQAQEMVDSTFQDQLEQVYRQGLGFFLDGQYIALPSGQKVTQFIIGDHYDLSLKGKGSKGLLDYFILPLLARKLIADCFLPEREDTYICNTLAVCIATPIEALRLGIGYGLTMIAIPASYGWNYSI